MLDILRTLGDQPHWHLLSLMLWHSDLLYFFSDCAEEEALCNASLQRVFPQGNRSWLDQGFSQDG